MLLDTLMKIEMEKEGAKKKKKTLKNERLDLLNFAEFPIVFMKNSFYHNKT